MPASGNAAASVHERRVGFGKTFARGTRTSSAYVPFVGPPRISYPSAGASSRSPQYRSG